MLFLHQFCVRRRIPAEQTNRQTTKIHQSRKESTSAMFDTEKKTLTVYQASGLKYFICFVSNSVNRHSGCSLFIFVFFCVIQCQVTQFHFGCFSEATSYGYFTQNIIVFVFVLKQQVSTLSENYALKVTPGQYHVIIFGVVFRLYRGNVNRNFYSILSEF